MSALLSIGEAQHKLLCADAEIGAVANNMAAEPHAALSRASEHIAQVRADLAAVQFVLRSVALQELLAYHESIEARLRHGAALMRVMIHNPMETNANKHASRAALLRTLIGAEPTAVTGAPKPPEDGGPNTSASFCYGGES